MAQELERLIGEFAWLYGLLSASFEYEPIEPFLRLLRVEGDGLGHFNVDCELNAEPLLVGPMLKYEFEIDQTEVAGIVAAFDKVLGAQNL